MTFTYKNPSDKETIWVGDVCFKPEASVVKSHRHPLFEQAVKNGTLILTISGDIVKPHGGFTVLFDRMEHGVAPQPVRNLLSGDKIELPVLEEEGFTFGGWFKDRDFEEAWDAETDTVTDNVTLFALWTEADAENGVAMQSDTEDGDDEPDEDTDGEDGADTEDND